MHLLKLKYMFFCSQQDNVQILSWKLASLCLGLSECFVRLYAQDTSPESVKSLIFFGLSL